MRFIYGWNGLAPDKHIVIIRGLDSDSFSFFTSFVKRYPTIGLFLTNDIGEERNDACSPFIDESVTSSIHTFLIRERPDDTSDADLIKLVLEDFPPYNEDEDPIVEEYSYKDFLGSMEISPKSLEPRDFTSRPEKFRARYLVNREMLSRIPVEENKEMLLKQFVSDFSKTIIENAEKYIRTDISYDDWGTMEVSFTLSIVPK